MDDTITAFFCDAGDPKTGLTPTIRIWAINVGSPGADSLVVGGGSPSTFMTEVGDGFYKFNFAAYNPRIDYNFRADAGAGSGLALTDRFAVGATEAPDPVEIWDVDESDATSVSGSIGESINDDLTTIISTQTTILGNQVTIIANQATMTTLLNTLIQYECGRSKIDPIAKTLTIFESDCTTVLKVFELRDTAGNPSILEVCERFPIGPGSPSCT